MYNIPLMNSLPDVPTTKELWQQEKSKYRHWILLFGIGVALILSLLLTSFIMNVVDKGDIIASLTNLDNGYFSIPSDIPVDQHQSYVNGEANKVFNTSFLILPILQIAALAFSLGIYLFTVFQSYKNKSFAKLSVWSSYIIIFLGFITLYNVFQLSWSSSSRIVIDKNIPGAIFQFINSFIILVVWGFSSPVGRIRRTFLQSERIWRIKNDPELQAQMQAYQSMMGGAATGFASSNNFANPFGPNVKTPPSNGNPSENTVNAQVVEPIVPSEQLELMKMPVEKLVQLAEKLNISGVQTMSKDELIDAIIRATS